MYSQSNEEAVILSYFGDFVGTLLDCGANNGKTLSNSLALIERNWQAVLVEPSPTAFAQLYLLHKDNNKVRCYNCAIGSHQGRMKFYESGSQLGTDDYALVSSLSILETNRWRRSGVKYNEIEVEVIPFKPLLIDSQVYHFITIDAESEDINILKQIDLKAVECRCLCIEWNSILANKREVEDYVLPFGFKLIHINAENLIFAL